MGAPVRQIGIREARSRFSDLLRAVKEGTEWIITQRGRPVARLSPVDLEELSLPEWLKRCEDAGRIVSLTKEGHRLPPPIPVADNIAQRFLDEDRTR